MRQCGDLCGVLLSPELYQPFDGGAYGNVLAPICQPHAHRTRADPFRERFVFGRRGRYHGRLFGSFAFLEDLSQIRRSFPRAVQRTA